MKHIPHRWQILNSIITSNNYENFVEVGVSAGDNARRMRDTLGDYKLGLHFLIDLPEENKDSRYRFVPQNLQKCIYIAKPSLDAVNDFKDNCVDCVFLDGDHTKENFIPEMKAWYKKLRVGGTLVYDEYLAPTGHSCYYRTKILDDIFGVEKPKIQQEKRPSEGTNCYFWWYEKTNENIFTE